jgi:hypothetical protein
MYQIIFAAKNQKKHGQQKTFREEFVEFLNEHGIESDETYP